MAEKFCRNTQTRAPAETSPRSLRRSYGDAKSRSFFTLLWQYASALPRAVPHRGERPSPHQETEVQASARNATRSRSNMPQNGCSAEILPSDASGIRRVKPSSDGRGGGGQSLVRYRSLRTLCCFQRTVPARVPVVMAQQSALNSKAPKDIRRLLPFLSFVEIRNNENEFQCQLFFVFFMNIFEKYFHYIFNQLILL